MTFKSYRNTFLSSGLSNPVRWYFIIILHIPTYFDIIHRSFHTTCCITSKEESLPVRFNATVTYKLKKRSHVFLMKMRLVT